MMGGQVVSRLLLVVSVVQCTRAAPSYTCPKNSVLVSGFHFSDFASTEYCFRWSGTDYYAFPMNALAGANACMPRGMACVYISISNIASFATGSFSNICGVSLCATPTPLSSGVMARLASSPRPIAIPSFGFDLPSFTNQNNYVLLRPTSTGPSTDLNGYVSDYYYDSSRLGGSMTIRPKSERGLGSPDSTAGMVLCACPST